MKKKKYMKPSMKVYEIGLPRLICASDGIPSFPGEGGYIPGIPGQHDDENKLA